MSKRFVSIQILTSLFLFNSFQSHATTKPIAAINYLNSKKVTELNPALQRLNELNVLLPDSKDKTKLKHLKETFGILSQTGSVTTKLNPLSHPFSSKNFHCFPSISKSSLFSPFHTAWEKSDTIEPTKIFPTNDWFQQMATFPKQDVSVSTGPYLITYNENGSLKYYIPHKFDFNESGIDGCIQQNSEKAFTLDCASSLNPHPFIKWRPSQVGNMIRHIVYKQMTYYVAQGSAFQAASYRQELPLITVKSSILGTSFSHQTLDNGIQKYRLKTSDVIYIFYGHTGLNLNFNRWAGTLSSSKPYTGVINAIAIPNNNSAKNYEKIADAHANVVVIRAQGSLIPNNEYQFSYMCENLLGSPTDEDPLIFLKEHQVQNLVDNNLYTFQGVKGSSINGDLSLYSGSSFAFKVSSLSLTEDVIPNLPNGSTGIAKSQANDLIAKGWLNKGISYALDLIPSSTINDSNKEIYQIALTLSYAKSILEIVEQEKNEILQQLYPLYNKLTQLLTEKWGLLKRDIEWGALVINAPDSDTELYLKNQLPDYGYLLYSLTLLADFENSYIDASEHFLDKTIPLEGYEGFTNKEIGDLLASEIGQTGQSPFQPLTRNFDIYQGHSWLSGIEGPSKNGNSIDKTSESVFGSFAVYAWLNQTQPDTTLSELAKTRWYLEAQSLKTYTYLTDDKSGIYSKVSLSFAKKYPVVSAMSDCTICHGSSSDSFSVSILASTIAPVSINQMENLFTDLKFTKRFSDYALKNWDASEKTDSSQSVCLQAIARIKPATAQKLLAQLEKTESTIFDRGTNPFILYVITLYAANRKLFD